MSDTKRGTEPGIRLGVLIIGSLLWDAEEHRKKWRNDQLDMGRAQRVCDVPIRYGRRSTKRGCSYTMVFSRELVDREQLGCAIVVPCSRTVNDTVGIVDEAVHLWTAETTNGENPKSRISADWGCVALLDHRLSNEVRRDWAGRVANEGCNYGQLNSAVDEEPAVDPQSGLLKIPWPTPVDGSDLSCDVLLATATNPTIVRGGYPSARQIAEAWNTPAGKQHVDYFYKNRESNINNRESDIETFQDGEIEECLRELSR